MINNLTTFLATSVASNHEAAVAMAPEAVVETPIVDFSTQVTRVNTSYNKYDSLIDKTATRSQADEFSLQEYLFGKDTNLF